MLKSIDSLEKARNFDWNDRSFDPSTGHSTVSLGCIDFHNRDWQTSKDAEEVIRYAIEQCPPIKLVPWSAIKPFINEKKMMTFGQLHNNSYQYMRYVHEGWTETIRPNHPIGGGAMDFMNADGHYQKLSTVSDHPDCNELNDEEENSLNSCFYHSAKAHWLINSIQKEGLRQPIQGHTRKLENAGTLEFQLTIHPGSIRCKVFETMDEPHFESLITDYADTFKDVPVMSADDILNYWRDLGGQTLSAIWTDGKIEFSLSSVGGLDFRKEVHAFNKKVTQLCKKKPVNIYLGYDSSHAEVFEVAKQSILDSVQSSKSGGVCHEFFNDYQVEVKKLDISEISEYNREYANQSTEFTYSRFLIPYLENYEGFSFFIDDDYIWKFSPMSLFYFLDPDNALACVQYDFKHHEETKMDGEKNVSYPRKLWSSMMIFNNGHEDCKKLTPEVVNTASGQFLHQFEWTNSISKIPHNKIATEGYDERVEESHHAVHYTRGGPWIKGMDCTDINMLEFYDKAKRRLRV